jgi:hypothetical protein
MPPGLTDRMRRGWRLTWPRRLAARPAWEYATGAETISGGDGGRLPLRTYQEFFTAAVDPAGRLSAGVTVEGPSRWGWPALDLLGVRWFVTGGLPPDQIKVLEANGFRIVQRDAWFLLWQRPAAPLARMVYDVDTVPDPDQRLARLQVGYPLRERAMVERPVAGLRRPATPATVQVTRRDHTRVRVSVRTGADGLLVLADPWYPSGRSRSTATRPSSSGSTTPSAACASPRRRPPGGVHLPGPRPPRPAWPSAGAPPLAWPRSGGGGAADGRACGRTLGELWGKDRRHRLWSPPRSGTVPDRSPGSLEGRHGVSRPPRPCRQPEAMARLRSRPAAMMLWFRGVGRAGRRPGRRWGRAVDQLHQRVLEGDQPGPPGLARQPVVIAGRQHRNLPCQPHQV